MIVVMGTSCYDEVLRPVKKTCFVIQYYAYSNVFIRVHNTPKRHRASRGLKRRRYEKLLGLLSDKVHTLPYDRIFLSQTIVSSFFFFFFEINYRISSVK